MQKVCIALPPEAASGFLSAGLYLAEAILHLDADLTLVVPAETAALLQRPLRPGDVEVESRLCTSEYVAETMRQALAADADGILLAYWPPRLLALVLQAPALAEAVKAGVQVLATVDGAWWSEGVDAELAHADTYRALEDQGVRFLGISQATLAKSPVRIHGVVRQGGLFPDWTARVARYRRRWPRPLRAAICRTLVWWGRPVWEKGLQAVVRIAEDAGLQPLLLPGCSQRMLQRALAHAAAVIYYPYRPYPGSIMLLEAQAAGVPVITRGIGGLAEYVAPGNGLVVKWEMEAAEAARAIRWAAPDPYRIRLQLAAVRGPQAVVAHLRRVLDSLSDY